MRYSPKNILCATDLSEMSNAALGYGVALARKYNAKLTICHTIDIPVTAAYEGMLVPVPVSARAIEEARSRASAEVQRLLEGAVNFEVKILEGRAAAEVSGLAAEIHADLVIVATHGRSGWKRALLGSVTEQLIHAVEAPFLTVTPFADALALEAPRDFHPRKIVLACDFSPDSMQAVSHAAALAQEFQAELHLVHVLEPSIYRTLGKTVADFAVRMEQAVREAVERKMRELLPVEVFNWSPVITAVLSGSIHSEILKYAKDHRADLIVLGIRGHTLLGELFVGSTTHRVLREAPCPVLTVREATQA